MSRLRWALTWLLVGAFCALAIRALLRPVTPSAIDAAPAAPAPATPPATQPGVAPAPADGAAQAPTAAMPPGAGAVAAPTADGAPTVLRTSALALRNEELVFGPPLAGFDVRAFLDAREGALSGYVSPADGADAATILQEVGLDFSVSPRVLLVLVELMSGAVETSGAGRLQAPFGSAMRAEAGAELRALSSRVAISLNEAYYVRRYAEGGDPSRAAQEAIQDVLARLDPAAGPARLGDFARTYAGWFGDPSASSVAAREAVPPALLLPWAEGETWHFTGGPHYSWGPGSTFGAVDFAPPSPQGCQASQEWVRAAMPGLVVSSRAGQVLVDADGDGHAGSGFVILYQHIATQDRVPVGTWLAAGDPIGRASCEGGFATGSHLHLARRLDGEWLPVDGGPAPLELSGWRFRAAGAEYDGRMEHAAQGSRTALKRRNGQATAVLSDNGPARRAELAEAWGAFGPGGQGREVASAEAVAAIPPFDAPEPRSQPQLQPQPESLAGVDALAASQDAGQAPGTGAGLDGPSMTETGLGPRGTAVELARPSGLTSTLAIRLLLDGRGRHDTPFTLALEREGVPQVALIGHTADDGRSAPLQLPPGVEGRFDLLLRAPGFVPSRVFGVELGGRASTQVDFASGGLVALRPGDMDGDGGVGLDDGLGWLGAWRRGQEGTDLDGDGRARLRDLWLLARPRGES